MGQRFLLSAVLSIISAFVPLYASAQDCACPQPRYVAEYSCPGGCDDTYFVGFGGDILNGCTSLQNASTYCGYAGCYRYVFALVDKGVCLYAKDKESVPLFPHKIDLAFDKENSPPLRRDIQAPGFSQGGYEFLSIGCGGGYFPADVS